MRRAGGGRWSSVVVALGLMTASCAGIELRQDVELARTHWVSDPSDQRAVTYAETLHDAFEGHAYRTADFTRRANEALAALGAGQSRSGARLATLIGYRGLLLLDLGRDREGWAELQRSMAVAPTLVATRGIVSVWGARKRSDKVAEACARTLPAMRTPDSRFKLLDVCVKNMHAPNETAALAWAPPEAAAMYREERARRAALAEQAAQTAAFEQQMQADQMAADQAQQAAQMASDQAQQATTAAIQQAIQIQMSMPPP